MWSSFTAWLRGFTRQKQEMAKPQRCPPRCGHISFTDGERLFVWGGHCKEGSGSRSPAIDEVWIFLPKFDAWITKKCSGVLPAGTSGTMHGMVFPYLYVFCGHCESVGHVSTMSRLHLDTFVWETVHVKEPMISPRDKAASWVYENKIYCFGGYGPDPEYTGLHLEWQESFVYEEGSYYGWNNQLLVFDPSTNEWSSTSSKKPAVTPLPRAAHATVLMRDKVFLFGGRHMDHRMNDLHCLDLKSLTWSGEIHPEGPVPAGRSWHTLSRLDEDRIFLCGGFSQTEEVFDDVWIYSVMERRWTEVMRHNYLPRGWHTAVVTRSQEVLVFGGFIRNILARDFSSHSVADTVVKFQFHPMSLKELCLQCVFADTAPETWEVLPKELQQWLETKRKLQANSLSQAPLRNWRWKSPLVLNGFRTVTEV